MRDKSNNIKIFLKLPMLGELWGNTRNFEKNLKSAYFGRLLINWPEFYVYRFWEGTLRPTKSTACIDLFLVLDYENRGQVHFIKIAISQSFNEILISDLLWQLGKYSKDTLWWWDQWPWPQGQSQIYNEFRYSGTSKSLQHYSLGGATYRQRRGYQNTKQLYWLLFDNQCLATFEITRQARLTSLLCFLLILAWMHRSSIHIWTDV
jgi:hypothetical protein